MITLGVIVSILVIIILLRFGVIAEYDENGFTLRARVGPLKIRIIPQRLTSPEDIKKKAERKAKRKAIKKAKKLKQKAKKAQDAVRPGLAEVFFTMLSSAKETFRRMKRRLLIKELTIYYTSGGKDPCVAAMSFGAANAVIGAIVPVLEKNFRIKRRDLRASADFDSDKQMIYFKAVISLAVWEAVYISFAILPAIIKLNSGKDVQEDGKTTDK